MKLDIAANRAAKNWSRRELFIRALWEILGSRLFWLSPRLLWPFRSWLLRQFGAEIGRHVHIHPTAKIAIPFNLRIGDRVGVGDGAILYALGPIAIGDDVTVSQYAHLCAGTHDYRLSEFPLVKPPISIQPGAWVGAEAFIHGNVTIGEYAIVGARAVVNRDVAAWSIVMGNPAQKFAERPPFDGANKSIRL